MFASIGAGRDETVLKVVRDNGWLVGLVGLHLALAYAAAVLFRLDFDGFVVKAAGGRILQLSPLFIAVLVLARRIHFARHVRTGDPVRWLVADLRDTVTDVPRMLSAAVALISISLFCASFSFFKSIIPMIQPFHLDEAFAQIDRTLHGGVDPYRIVLAVFGHPWIISAINAAYHFWAILLFFMVFLAAFAARNLQARASFLLAFVLTWAVGGNLLATVLSSAGPVYYQRIGLGDTFAPLMDHLAAAHSVSPVWALGIQEMLWSGYNAAGPSFGISAMPSMHVASSTLLALYAFTWSRGFGIALSVFAGIIMIGSVLLGWHYAIDGYLGAALAWGCWRAARWLTRRLPA